VALTRRGILAFGSALALALGLAVAGCGQAQQSSGIDWKIEISGAVDQPVTVSYDDLAGMPQTKLTDVLMRKSRGEDQKTNWEGAAFKDVLAKAKLKPNATGITAMAEDGYAIQIPLADLDKGVVALKSEGKRIADDGQGAVRVVIPDKPANFWILGLRKIKVEDQPIVAPTPKPETSPTPKP
jgi:DMSO/TMAO reductase YedYZ molybdopterin-dependent catalytic subunit